MAGLLDMFSNGGAGFMPAIRNNSDALLQTGLGLLSGRTANEQAAMGLKGFSDARKQNMTLKALEKYDPELAQLAQSGGISPADAFKLAYQKRAQANDPGTQLDMEYKRAQIDRLRREPQGNQESFYGNPIAVQNADGSISYGQIGSRGSFKPIQLSEGQTFAPNTRTVDLGTEAVTIGPGGTEVRRDRKDIAGVEAQKEIGQAEGAAQAGAPGDMQAAINAKSLLNDIRTDPAKAWGTGGTSIFNSIPGTAGKGFQKKVDQATSGAFLTAIEQMRGLGTLSNAEGQTAKDAVTRMDTALRQEDFDAALNDYERLIDQALARAQARMGDRTLRGPQPSMGQPQRLRFNPQTGELE